MPAIRRGGFTRCVVRQPGMRFPWSALNQCRRSSRGSTRITASRGCGEGAFVARTMMCPVPWWRRSGARRPAARWFRPHGPASCRHVQMCSGRMRDGAGLWLLGAFLSRFMGGEPMKLATKVDAGGGRPLRACRTVPCCRRSSRSCAGPASWPSTWSCVTNRLVMPSSRCSFWISRRVCAQLGVEVGQGLVEQEHLRLAHDGAAHGHALALAAGEFARLALQQVAQFQDLGGLVHAAP